MTAMAENHCLICWVVIQKGQTFCPSCYASIMRKYYPKEQNQPKTKKEVRTMKINWGVRFANEKFWLAFIPGALLVVSLILDLFGVKIDFGEIGNKLAEIVKAVFALLAILGIVNDPTTDGMGDSKRAMTYELPFKDWADEED